MKPHPTSSVVPRPRHALSLLPRLRCCHPLTAGAAWITAQQLGWWRAASRAVRGLVRLLLLYTCFLLAQPAHAETVTQRFTKAQQLFDQDKLAQAGSLVTINVKKYPAHQPSRLLLGRIYYRMGNYARAARHFGRVDPDIVSGDAAYEYGVTLFNANNCNRAKRGLQRVAGNNKYAPLAYFYRGLCHLRSREWQQAGVLLTRATPLPPSLTSYRRKALDTARKGAREERRSPISAGAPYQQYAAPAPMLPPPNYLYAPSPVPGQPLGQPALAGPPAPKPAAAALTTVTTPSLTITKEAVTRDFFGHKLQDSEKLTVLVKVAGSGKYLYAPVAGGAQPYVSLSTDLARNSVDATGSSTEYLTYTDTPGEIVEKEGATPSTSTKQLLFNFQPEGGYPIGGKYEATLGLKYSLKLENMRQSGKSGKRGPYAGFDMDFDTLTLKLTGALTQNTDAQDAVHDTDLTVGGEVTKSWGQIAADAAAQYTRTTQTTLPPAGVVTLAGSTTPSTFDGTVTVMRANLAKSWDSFTLTAGVTNTTYTPSSAAYVKADEDNSFKTELTGTKSTDFGGTLTLTAFLTKYSAYKKSVADSTQPPPPAGEKPPQVVVSTEGAQQGFLASIKLAPVEWAFGSLSYKYATATYTFADQVYEAAFKDIVPEAASEYAISLGVSRRF